MAARIVLGSEHFSYLEEMKHFLSSAILDDALLIVCQGLKLDGRTTKAQTIPIKKGSLRGAQVSNDIYKVFGDLSMGRSNQLSTNISINPLKNSRSKDLLCRSIDGYSALSVNINYSGATLSKTRLIDNSRSEVLFKVHAIIASPRIDQFLKEIRRFGSFFISQYIQSTLSWHSSGLNFANKLVFDNDVSDFIGRKLFSLNKFYPEMDFALWQYEADLDALVLESCSKDMYQVEPFVGEELAGRCYEENAASEFSDLRRIDLEDRPKIRNFNEALYSDLGWRSAYLQPITLPGHHNAVLGCFRKKSGKFSNFQLEIIKSISMDLTYLLLLKQQLQQEMKLRAYVDKISPIVELGREAESRLHDVKDNLQSVRGRLTIIAKSDPNSAKFRKEISSSQLLLEKTSELLSKQLTSYQVTKKRPRKDNLNKIIEELEPRFLIEADRFNVSLEVVQSSSDIFANVQRYFIGRAISNVVHNAVHFAATGHDRRREVLLNTELVNDRVLIEVTDTGPGVTPENAELIFEDGFSTRYGGFGVGLASVKRIMKEHRGHIRVICNDEYDGGKFILDLPAIFD